MSTSVTKQVQDQVTTVTTPAARVYAIDASHSSASFKVRHLMVSNVRGELGQISGQVVIDDIDITRSSVDVTIDVSAVNTHDVKRDEHLRSADFFDVAQFPSITFKSKRVQPGKGGDLFVTGDLTIRGITREVTLDVEPLSPEVNDPWGNVKRGASGPRPHQPQGLQRGLERGARRGGSAGRRRGRRHPGGRARPQGWLTTWPAPRHLVQAAH
jgi:polyisoprenoid-binding protein YceI